MSFRSYLARLRELVYPAARKPAKRRHTRTLPRLECLEDRTALSTIKWINRGLPGVDTDGFEAAFGTNAETARAIIDTSIANWERVIVNFNWDDADIEFFSLIVKAEDTYDPDEPDKHRRAHTSGDHDDGDDVPFAATLTLDDDAGDDGRSDPSVPDWSFDATPGDNSEFTAIQDRDTAKGTMDGNDMLRTAMHELGHAFGISESADGFEADDLRIGEHLLHTGIDDPLDSNEEGELILYHGTAGQLLFTDAGGLHLWEGDRLGPVEQAALQAFFNSFPAPLPLNPADYRGAVSDLMNSGRNSGNNERLLISDLDARILAEAYGYDIALPSTLPNLSYLANLDSTSGVLRINGDPENFADDAIVLARQGDFIAVNVIGQDILFPFASVTSIRVDTRAVLDGDDTVTVDFAGGNPIPSGGLEFRGGDGDDVLAVAAKGVTTTYVVDRSQIQVGDHAFSYWIDEVEELAITPNAGATTVRVTDTSWDVEKLTIHGTAGVDRIYLDGRHGDTFIQVETLGSSDKVVLGEGPGRLDDLQGDAAIVILAGEGSSDALEFDDSADAFGNEYTLFRGNSVRGFVYRRDPALAGELTVAYEGFEGLGLTAGGGTNTISVRSTLSETPVKITTGSGSNDVILNSEGSVTGGGTADGIRSKVTVKGTGTKDVVHIGDYEDSTADRVTITEDSVGGGEGDSFFGGGRLLYSGLEELNVNLSLEVKDADKVQQVFVTGTALGTPVAINTGNAGADVFIGLAPSDKETTGLVGAVRSLVTVVGQGGTNRLFVDDGGAEGAKTVTVTDSTVGAWNDAAGHDTYFAKGGSVTYFGIDELTVRTGEGDDTAYVRSTNSATETTLDTGYGRDAVLVGSNGPGDGSAVDGIVSRLTVRGGGNSGDNLTLDDRGSLLAKRLTVTATQVGAGSGDTLFGGGTLDYSGVGSLTLLLGANNDTVYLLSTDADTGVRVEGNGGRNNVFVDSNGDATGGTVDLIVSKVTVVGGPDGLDGVALRDTSDATGDDVTLTATAVGGEPGDEFFGEGGSLTYSGLAKLSILAGAGADDIDVRSTAAKTQTAIDAGWGDDDVRVDSNGAARGGTVNQVRGPLGVLGGGDTNTLTLNDSSDARANAVTVTATQVGAGPGDSFFGQGGSLVYGGFSALTVNLGSGGDTVAIRGTSPGTATTVNAGGGANAVTVGYLTSRGGGVGRIVSSLTVRGGSSGTTALTLDDSGNSVGKTVSVSPTSARSGTVGKVVGDTFFGAGGGLTYEELTALTLNLGSGADTVRVRPATTVTGTEFFFDGNSPTKGTGDRLEVDLTGVGSASLSQGKGWATLKSATHARLNFREFETATFSPPLPGSLAAEALALAFAELARESGQ